ncbi:methyl-accepting chemotaxis protein [Methanomicrobium sp. W14]|uniref:methyl-accepting chemotaxis protein n=1 Tax=Methanomicrobium sp. W14 TaxID=2817839 RepID=UPI001AE671D5|nr:methyl-accepting chemotaxis protein [Methanomicrobium sp. W14]MBP2132166.1 methyl-accepting chemotaxis protein [Methanomicrobium sp. W14]
MIKGEFKEIIRDFIKNPSGPIFNSENYDGDEKEYAQLMNLLMNKIKEIEIIREKNDKKAQKLQKRADAFLKFNPQGIAVLAADKHRLGLNKEYEREWRGSYEELMAKKLYDFDITVTGGDDFYASFETKKQAVSDLEIRWPEGEVTYLRLFQTPILDENGEIDVNYYIYQDLTEQIVKLKQIQQLEKVSDSIVRENPMPIILWNKNLSIDKTNRAFIKLSGYSDDEIKSITIKDFKYHKQAGESVLETFESKKESHGEATIEFPAGNKVVERYNIPFLDDSGEVSSVLTVYNDITKLREEMSNSEKLQRRADAFLKLNPQGIAVLAADKHRLDLNKEYEREWRGSYEELMAKKLYDFDITVTGGDDFYASFETRKQAVSDLEIRWPEGEVTCLRLFQTPILDENGEIDVNYYIYQDLTEITQELKEVKKLQKRADTFIKDNPQAIAVLAPDKHRLDLNRQYEEKWRGSYEELMAKKLYDFDIEFTGDDFYASFETRKKAVSDLEIKWPDKTKTYLRLFQTPILNDSGEIDVNYYIYQDRTSEIIQKMYMDKEVDKVASDLKEIAAGKPDNIKLDVGDSDEYTKEIRKVFVEISASIKSVSDTLKSLINDIDTLAIAGKNGELKTRADNRLYEGDFATLVENLNKLMEAVATPIFEAMQISGHYAKGDFSARFTDSITVSGDFEKFKEELNNIGESVSKNLKITDNITKQVSVNSSEVSKGTDEIAKAAEGVANTSQKTAELTKNLLASIEDISRQIADLSASNEEIAGTSQEVLNSADQVVSIGIEAQNLGNDANKRMASVESIASESVKEIHDLSEKINEVGKVVKLINNITGQINLLALNAAIEAARAGEHGRGFAVVAGEVKNLAAEARTATDSIENVVSSVQVSSEKTAKAINSANTEILDGVKSVTKTIEVLNTIIKNAGQVKNDIGEIAKAIEDQANISNSVVHSTETGTEKTKEVQREAEELAALAEEASASVEEIGSATYEVTELVKKLDEANSAFKY